MKPTAIQIVDLSVRWGLVTVVAEDNSVVRQRRITAEQEEAVRLRGEVPAGCSEEEWKSGRVMVNGRPCLEGQAVVRNDGWILVNHGITEEDDRVQVKHMLIPPHEWALVDGVVHVDEAVCAAMGM